MQRIEQAIKPTQQQLDAFDRLRIASAEAGNQLQASCPTQMPQTPLDRFDAVAKRLQAMDDAIKTVRPALASFLCLINRRAESTVQYARTAEEWLFVPPGLEHVAATILFLRPFFQGQFTQKHLCQPFGGQSTQSRCLGAGPRSHCDLPIGDIIFASHGLAGTLDCHLFPLFGSHLNFAKSLAIHWLGLRIASVA